MKFQEMSNDDFCKIRSIEELRSVRAILNERLARSQMLLEESKQQIRLSATAHAGNDLDQSVMFFCYQFVLYFLIQHNQQAILE